MLMIEKKVFLRKSLNNNKKVKNLGNLPKLGPLYDFDSLFWHSEAQIRGVTLRNDLLFWHFWSPNKVVGSTYLSGFLKKSASASLFKEHSFDQNSQSEFQNYAWFLEL